MQALTIAERLATLRENNNFSPIDSASKAIPTPLAAFLSIYNKAGNEGYTEYMEGAKALIAYCSPIDIPTVDSCLLPASANAALVDGYHLDRLARLLAGKTSDYASMQEYLSRVLYIEKLCLYLTCHAILNNTGEP